MKIAILGAGAFGTALAQNYAKAGHPVQLWTRSAEHATQMQTRGVNQAYLPDVPLDPDIEITSNITDIRAAQAILLAIPAQKISAFATENREMLSDRSVISCAKGIDLKSLTTPAATLATVLPNTPVYALSGPGFARDLALGLPTAMVIAGPKPQLSDIQHALSSHTLRLYRSEHRDSVEMGGALKNIIAIGCGAVMGAGLGESARAALLTRGFHEMQQILHSMEYSSEPLHGLSGLGDLTLTALSPSSRNYRHGYHIGAGQDITTTQTTEGVATAQAMTQLAQERNIDIPITRAIHALCTGTQTIQTLATTLMQRNLKEE